MKVSKNNMQIELSKKQYWHLLRAVYMADWMANAICEADMEEDKGIEEIQDYVFSFAKEMGFEKYVQYDEGLKEHFATFDLEDEQSVRSHIDRYDEHITWENLVDWLGDRDFSRKYSEEEIKNMSREEYFIKRMECETPWEEELAEYGLERITIDESNETKE